MWIKLLEQKTLWKKEKMLVTSIFSFFHIVFNSHISQVHSKSELCGEGLFNRLFHRVSWTHRKLASRFFRLGSILFVNALSPLCPDNISHSFEVKGMTCIFFYDCRHRRMKEALNRARQPKGNAAKGLTYRQAESPDDLPKMDLHFAEDTDVTSEYDGATTIQENPLSDQGVNEGYLQSSVSDEMDREMNEIEIETAVVPYDDDFGYPSGRTKYSGQMRTFQADDSTSSGSAQSDSTGGSRSVLVNDDSKNAGSKLTSWDSDDKIHTQGAEVSIT